MASLEDTVGPGHHGSRPQTRRPAEEDLGREWCCDVLDHGMNIQEAIEAPRFRCYEGTRVQMEERFPVHLRRALGDLGHEVDVIEAWSGSVGGAQGIVVDRDSGVLQGGADPRRDGYAIGL